MSTTTEPIPPSSSPSAESFTPSLRPIETAPSQTLVQGPGFARMVGFAGLFALVLGTVVIVTNMALTPRWITTGWGYMFAAVGIVLLMYHAVSDPEQEVRRMYGLFSALLLVIALIAAIAPGPVFGSAITKTWGYNLLPWGVGFGFLSLIFAIPFARQETDKTYRSYAELGMLGVGAALAVGSLVIGVFKPDFLVGPGIALALLGLGFLAAYMGQVDTSEGIGYQVAFALGALGAAVALYALAKTTVPTLLYDGPNVLRKANRALDWWKVAARLLAIAVFVGIAALAARKQLPLWLRSTLGAIGVSGVVILLIASFNAHTITETPKPFMIPNGIILMGLGLLYLVVSLGICSDNQFVTLTRRELSAYFLSPIGYLVLGGMVAVQWLAYWEFYGDLASAGKQQASIPEPIVRFYLFALTPILCVILPIPALTMRLLAEEKRTGSLEVLLTAPVNETPIVLSKFIATWIFFLICWLPAGLFLIPLRIEGGAPFDYRPLLSFYLALAVCGSAFTAVGLFFSAMTRNQIVAAVLTFMVLVGLVVCFFIKNSAVGVGATGQILLARLSYIDMWRESLQGQLPVRDLLVWLSATIFFLFLSVKVLDTRKWS